MAHTGILNINQLPVPGLNHVSGLEIGHPVRAHELIVRPAGKYLAPNTRTQHITPGNRNHTPQISGDASDLDGLGDPYYQIGDMQQCGRLDLGH
jgi:hypothetical protein